MTDKIKASEVVGELRKASRLYEVFKHAAEAAELLASFEKEKNKLEKEVASLSKECLELDAACDLVINKTNEVKQEAEDAKYTKDQLIKEAKDTATEIINKAKVEAESAKKAVKDWVSGSEEEIEKIKQEIKQLENRKLDAIKAARKAEETVKIIKDNALKALG